MVSRESIPITLLIARVVLQKWFPWTLQEESESRWSLNAGSLNESLDRDFSMCFCMRKCPPQTVYLHCSVAFCARLHLSSLPRNWEYSRLFQTTSISGFRSLKAMWAKLDFCASLHVSRCVWMIKVTLMANVTAAKRSQSDPMTLSGPCHKDRPCIMIDCMQFSHFYSPQNTFRTCL